jgi:hypothetical protein
MPRPEPAASDAQEGTTADPVPFSTNFSTGSPILTDDVAILAIQVL